MSARLPSMGMKEIMQTSSTGAASASSICHNPQSVGFGDTNSNIALTLRNDKNARKSKVHTER